MARHRRKRPKHQRAGCLLCKPWKDERGKNGAWSGGQAPRRRDHATRADLRAYREGDGDW